MFENIQSRTKKRTVIASVYGAIFLLTVFVVWSAVRPDPTCFDGKRNQNETGVDCGGVCSQECAVVPQAKGLEIGETAVVQTGVDSFEAFFSVRNPNARYGSPRAMYTVEYLSSSGEVVESISGSTFLVPGEDRNIVLSPVFSSVPIADMAVTFDDIEWVEFSGFTIPELQVSRKRFEAISGGAGFAQVYALVSNNSPFDFQTIFVTVVVRGEDGTPLAFHKTDLNTVNASEQRDFELTWPAEFPGDVGQVDIEARADVYDSENFIRRYLPGGRFQELR